MNKILYLTDLNYVAKGRNYCTDDDIAFAKSFIHWNDISNGIQRVDA